MTFQRYTREAKAVVATALDNAGIESHVEDVLEALLQSDCHATRVLARLHITPEQFNSKLDVVKKAAAFQTSLGTQDQLMQRCFNACRSAGLTHVGTLGLLIGITERMIEVVDELKKMGVVAAMLIYTANLESLHADLRSVLFKERYGGETPFGELSALASSLIKVTPGGAPPTETRQILMGIMERPDSIGALACIRAGADVARIMTRLESGSGPKVRTSPHIKPLLGLARRVQEEMGGTQVNSGHILLAIFGDAWSSGAQVLIDEGLYYEGLWLGVAQLGDIEA